MADFTTNYNQMVSNIRTTYPNADVFLLTHIPYSYSSASRPTITDELLEEFNAVIRNVVSANEKCYLVDLYNDSGITQATHKTYMGDEGLHPNASGMSKISDTLINALKSKYLG